MSCGQVHSQARQLVAAQQPVRLVAETLEISRSSLYYRPQPRSSRADRRHDQRIVEVCGDQPAFGYRRVQWWLEDVGGLRVNRKRVLRAMRERGLLVRSRRFRVSRRITCPYSIASALLRIAFSLPSAEPCSRARWISDTPAENAVFALWSRSQWTSLNGALLRGADRAGWQQVLRLVTAITGLGEQGHSSKFRRSGEWCVDFGMQAVPGNCAWP